MRRRTFLEGLGGLGVAGAATLVAGGAAGGRGGVSIGPVEYKGWRDAYRLTNGTVEVVVVPSVARVMRYGFVGGPNLLWENPTVAGKPIPLDTWPAGGGTGGDKIWPWDQDDWPKIIGRGWPAPPAADQAPHTAEIVAPDTLRMTSPRVIPWGFRIVRDIRLAPNGAAVTFTNRFVRYRSGPSFPAAVWTITQVPAADGPVWARLVPGSSLPKGFRPDDAPAAFRSITPMGPDGRVLRIERRPDNGTKAFFDADLLAVRAGDTLFTVRPAPGPAPADNAGASNAPGDRAQVYAQNDSAADAARGITPYYELELTSPKRALGPAGDTLTFPVVWDLVRLPEGQRDDAGVVRALG